MLICTVPSQRRRGSPTPSNVAERLIRISNVPPIERVRSPRQAQKRRLEGWSDCRFILPKTTLEGLKQVAIVLAEQGQHSPWPKERRRYPRTKSHLVGEALDNFFRQLGFEEFCVQKEQER
jgi:hypothetical protein